MKTLVFVRHAKSSWDDPGVRDHDRVLNARGLRDAPEMARRLRARGVRPELILTSSAVRARMTAQFFAAELGLDDAQIVVDEHLYAASTRDLLEAVGRVGDEVERLMVVGHNPEFSELAHSFSPHIVHLPTCAVVEFEFDVDSWNELDDAAPRRSRFDSPRSGGASLGGDEA